MTLQQFYKKAITPATISFVVVLLLYLLQLPVLILNYIWDWGISTECQATYFVVSTTVLILYGIAYAVLLNFKD